MFTLLSSTQNTAEISFIPAISSNTIYGIDIQNLEISGASLISADLISNHEWDIKGLTINENIINLSAASMNGIAVDINEEIVRLNIQFSEKWSEIEINTSLIYVNDIPLDFSSLDFTNPYSNEVSTITSSNTGSVVENADITTVIYDADATDPDGDTLTYSVSGTDASYVSIDSDDGKVRLLIPADYETKDSYTFDVTASDGELSDTQNVTINVTDDTEAPTLRDYKWAPVLSSEDGIVPIDDALFLQIRN